MSRTYPIEIDSDGNIVGIFPDDVEAQEMGRVRIERLSRVEFNNDLQKWQVEVDGTILRLFNTREEALDYENIFFMNEGNFQKAKARVGK